MRFRNKLQILFFLFAISSCTTKNSIRKIDSDLESVSQTNIDSLWQDIKNDSSKSGLIDKLKEKHNLSEVRGAVLEWNIDRHNFTIGNHVFILHTLYNRVVYKEILEKNKDLDLELLMSDEDFPLSTSFVRFKLIHSNIDSVLYNSINQNHENVYGEQIDFGKYEKENTQYLENEVGFTCGPDASLSSIGKQALNLVIQKDTATLEEWIRSYRAPLKTFAYAGFKALECQGFEIPNDILKIMYHLEHEKMDMKIRYGCSPTFHRYSMESMISDQWNIKSFTRIVDCE